VMHINSCAYSISTPATPCNSPTRTNAPPDPEKCLRTPEVRSDRYAVCIVGVLALIAGFLQTLMQTGPDLIGRVRLPPALIADHQYSPGCDPDDAG
jgi:hypothetical protein